MNLMFTARRLTHISILAGWRCRLIVPGLYCLVVSIAPLAWCQRAPSAPESPWLPGGNQISRSIEVVSSHQVKLADQHVYSLGDLIDIAESYNPRTRAAWNQAKANAASVGIAKSELYPTIVATAVGKTFLNPPLLYRTFVIQDIGLFTTAVHLNYTLLDFGARRTEITAAQAKLVAANLNFNNEHLVLVRNVSQAYYSLLNATGLRKAAEVSLKDAQTVEAAAVESQSEWSRNGAGSARIPCGYGESKISTSKRNRCRKGSHRQSRPSDYGKSCPSLQNRGARRPLHPGEPRSIRRGCDPARISEKARSASGSS
jgi:hypothetical protein